MARNTYYNKRRKKSQINTTGIAEFINKYLTTLLSNESCKCCSALHRFQCNLNNLDKSFSPNASQNETVESRLFVAVCYVDFNILCELRVSNVTAERDGERCTLMLSSLERITIFRREVHNIKLSLRISAGTFRLGVKKKIPNAFHISLHLPSERYSLRDEFYEDFHEGQARFIKRIGKVFLEQRKGFDKRTVIYPVSSLRIPVSLTMSGYRRLN
ncbi:hypothetical protein V1478_017723 [Vespula squamosa]|uniref:Uncharacterized protein n=1 Tax=Vespula squamosa TaxID=30214 RepID=A0ABD1ZWN6_VESSQ